MCPVKNRGRPSRSRPIRLRTRELKFGVDDLNPYVDERERERLRGILTNARNEGLFTPQTLARDQISIPGELKSAMFQAQAAARHMIRQGAGGKQVHIGSVRTLLGLRGRGYAAYCASKGGLAILCKQLAAEWAPHRINVNVVAPTFVRTEQVAHMLSDPQFYSALVARIPLGRIAEPEDVWNAVLFFVSSASDFVTGQTLYLDGGITATQSSARYLSFRNSAGVSARRVKRARWMAPLK